MISDLASQLNSFINRSQIYLYPWLLFLAVLWVINILNWMIGSRLNKTFGLYSRRLDGLLGIIFSPFLHQNFNHLFFNSIPLFILGLVILSRGLNLFISVSILTILVGGFGVWLFGRRAIHIGASGVVTGYFGFILTTACLYPNFTTLLLAMIVVYYFGSIFLGIFPQEDKVSWESHFFGFLSGILSAYINLKVFYVF
jgi:membrane associated rhomboid family serine protease